MIHNVRYQATHKKGLKIIIPKQNLQSLQIALAPAKSGTTSENLLNEICQIIYSFYQAK